MPDCLFCKIINKEISANIIYEDDATLAFLDIRPINPGHTLVIPKKHFEHCLKTTDEALSSIMRTIKKITPSILKTVGAESFNIGVNCGRTAGQVIFHTHFHIMPRFSDDGHKLWRSKENITSDTLVALAQSIKNAMETS